MPPSPHHNTQSHENHRGTFTKAAKTLPDVGRKDFEEELGEERVLVDLETAMAA